MSTPETPRIWTIGGWHDCPVIVGPALNGRSIEVVEKAPVDAERERLLDLIEDLLVVIKLSTVNGSLEPYNRAKARLREYGRLGG